MSLLDGLIAWYDLEESSGTRYDAHGSNDLTPSGPVGQMAGVVGNAAQFIQASSGALDTPAGAFNVTGDFAIAFWWRAGAGDNNFIIDALSGYSGGGIRVQERDGYDLVGTSQVRTGMSFPEGEWHFYVIGADNDCPRVSMDGAPAATGSSAGPRTQTDRVLRFGGRLSNSRYPNGDLDSVGLWQGRFLTDAEIAQLYNSGNGLGYADLSGGSEQPTEVTGSAANVSQTASASVEVEVAASAQVANPAQTATAAAQLQAGVSASVQNAVQSASGSTDVDVSAAAAVTNDPQAARASVGIVAPGISAQVTNGPQSASATLTSEAALSASVANGGQQASVSASVVLTSDASVINAAQTLRAAALLAVSLSGSAANSPQAVSITAINGIVRVAASMDPSGRMAFGMAHSGRLTHGMAHSGELLITDP